MRKLEGMIALVTAGTSGIGLATAKLFVDAGAYVFITGRRKQDVIAAVKEIGRNVSGIRADVGSLAELDRLVAYIKDERGRLDIVFASARIAKPAPRRTTTEEIYDSLFNINVQGLLATVQTALPLMPDGASLILNAFVVASKDLPSISLSVGPS